MQGWSIECCASHNLVSALDLCERAIERFMAFAVVFCACDGMCGLAIREDAPRDAWRGPQTTRRT